MKTDTEIKVKGTKALIKAMGTVDAERYITLMTREKFDYTEWRRTILPAGSIHEVSKAAMQYKKKSARSR
jgi:hypothetical protein